jgi:hypothetical protein
MGKDVDKPIFIIGAPRSGTTIFGVIFSYHPQLAWFSHLSDKYPRIPQLAIASRVFDFPVFGPILFKGRRPWILPHPTEGWNIWRYCSPVFRPPVLPNEPPQPPTETDVTEDSRRRIRKVIKGHLVWQMKPRFMTKYTEFPRIRYLNEIFPDSQFIHILRDGRAVSNSIYNFMIGRGWFSQNERDSWEKNWPEEWVQAYHESNKSRAVFAGMIWQYYVTEILREKNTISESRYIEVRYEELMEDSRQTMKRVTDFCGLEWSESFKNYIDMFSLKSRNFKWKENLDTRQKDLLESALRDSLTSLNYI